MRRKNKHLQLIQFLSLSLLIYILVNAMQNIKIHVVYSSGLGPFFFIGFVILLIVFLYMKG
ncbi:hypothetical protein [Niallia endozanthoxylica]|uniref:Uncharacterized protein n=1 Tax=Niallia endozanthoxylica TaxID=2036016 RepID=A0A5J5I2E1_9BACI|nr:hypothetical protein [Niallia endozanthoxylica]KAA9029954.1 hypothetical protein F4V44_02820 [Niallia endozanthoxylica]